MVEGARLLKEWLEAQRGRSQVQIADMFGLNQSSVSGWVRGKSVPDPTHRAMLERLTGIPASKWFDDAEAAAWKAIDDAVGAKKRPRARRRAAARSAA